MHLKISAGLLCLLCAVTFCGGQDPTTATTTAPNATITSNITLPTSPPPTAATNGSTVSMTTVDTNTTQPTSITPTPNTGLSDGAIAGIVIGSIAGAGLLGGGIYGALKYTGKI